MTSPEIAANTARADSTQPQLKGNLGFLSLFFSVMAYNAPLVTVIGVIPTMVAFGNGVGTPISFIVAGAIIACFAVAFTRMAKLMPRPGGFYSMITAGLGREVGLGSGFVALLGYFCVYAVNFPFGGIVLGSLVSNTFHGPSLPWYVWGAVFWAGTAVLGYMKVDLSAKVLTILLLCELAIAFSYDLLVLFKGGAHHAGISLAPISPQHWISGSFGIGLMFALALYGGFEVTVLFREEVRNPDRTVPRATYSVIVVAMLIFGLSSFAFINALGIDKAVAAASANPTGSVTDSLMVFGGNLLSDFGTIMVTTSSFAAMLAAHNITARYVFNLSADGIFPRKLSGVHRRHGSPHLASITTSAGGLIMTVVIILTRVGAITFYTAVLGLTSLVILLFLFIASLAIPAYLNREGRQHTAWSRLFFPALAAIGLGTGLVLASWNFPTLVGGSWGLAGPIMVLIAALFIVGLVMASVYHRVKPDIYAKIGRQ